MTDPDGLVDEHGETVTLRRVTDPVYDQNDVLDEDASTIETVEIPAIVSQPTDELQTRLEGRVETASLQATVKSTVDVSASREGSRDTIERAGDTFAVVDVADDQHPFLDVGKKTLALAQRDG